MANKILMVAYNNQLHKCHLYDDIPKVITVGQEWRDTITFPTLNRSQSITINWNGLECKIDDEELKGHLSIAVLSKPMDFYLMNEESVSIYDIAGRKTITFGPSYSSDIVLDSQSSDFVILRNNINNPFHLEVNCGNVYHNHSQCESGIVETGDQIFVDGVLITIGLEDIQVMATNKPINSNLVELVEADNPFTGEYPDYHRSPRIIYREPNEKRVIAKPSHKPSKPSEQLARTIVPPLIMIIALIIISLVQPRGIYIIVMLSVTVATIVFSVTSYIKSVKKYKTDMREREDSYKDYLLRKTRELYSASEEQRHALMYHYPSIDKIRKMAVSVESRMYEKTVYHHDFLNFRAGLGKANASFHIEFNEEEFTQEKDELVEEARELLSAYQEIGDVPVVTSLKKGPVGYIGGRRLVIEQLQLLVMQLSVFHSYHDLQFINIFPEEEKDEWDWMRWLPHASLRDVNVRGFIYHERSRDQVLYSLYQLLKERKQILDETNNKQEKPYFTPHFVVLITDEKLILDHSVMEFFNEDPSDIGVSLIFVQDVMHALPEHVKTVIDIRDAKDGKIILEQGELVEKKFLLDHFPKDFNKEEVSRALAPINHLQNLKNSIPENVTFLDMYKVEKVGELNISSRWNTNESYKSLAVPLGLRGKEDIVQLNLHEKAHGPHGLIAGTTGSGKSEIIQSYIISLAVNFHPYEVAFLLIDYKGGGMANLFRKLPHLLGTITNLDKAQSMRALASIKAELQRRQRIFGEHNVNHINQYQKLYKQGKASKPMPHLFLISDEFAELKSEQPDFMKELVSTARIGRSLGIHLILATQKPSGVVDDQIWSNSKFKLALKVQNASDSNEILKTPDAAEITLPGRAYLQVGNNEIYELFQSAWSGADYVPERDNYEHIDTTIYAINELGQYDILTTDLSGLEHKDTIEKTPTELEAVIDYIASFAKDEALEPLPRPWLPPLPEQILPGDIHSIPFEEAWLKPKQPLVATIGLMDQPELQSQSPISINVTKDGHLAVFSSPGYGKSTFLQTVVMDLVRQHNPEQLNLYLLDFGTNGLLPLKDIPHVADTILIDEEEKIGKLIRLLTNTIKERKQKLSQFGVANIEMYEKASGDNVSNICIVIDNYDTIRDVEFGNEFEKIITQIAREGSSVGIHLMISAGRQSAMRMPLISNIKTQVALYLIEETEVRSIVGRTDIELEEIKGRGLVKLDEPTLFQTMLPTDQAENLLQIQAIKEEVKLMRESWDGELPMSIPMVPEILDFNKFKKWKETQEIFAKQEVTFAVDMVDVRPVPIRIERESPFKVVGVDYHKVVDTVSIMIDSCNEQSKTEVIVIDNEEYTFSEYSRAQCNYGVGKAYFTQIFDTIHGWYENRRNAVSELRKNNASHEEINALKNEMNLVVIFITDILMLKNKLDLTMEGDFIQLLKQSKDYNIGFVFAGPITALEGYDDLTKYLRDAGSSIVFSELKNQNVFNVSNRIMHEKKLEAYEAYYITGNMQTKIKTAKREVFEHETV
ncbi:type VII secretion protein EssC [Oceanobacillus bengalensis]|uniref:Type VII secretion protein EssC n=1 Tax=Oceanobacillus bengalensis TaxID=1435466 RepID=A0A494Z2X2_9BACI|nr:type VII secretion protein EssC [Oceanobacillus bengalensis]RKQ16841.1 type VII secretion protein EssC [Oceanobacillus bengalensis]